jgi:hypothetical protein
MPQFDFHGELFEVRSTVIDALADHGYVWLSHYGAVDLQHDIYGMEVTAIHQENDARGIEEVLRHLLPEWRHVRTYYEDHNTREIGWKVMISRLQECFDDPALAGARIDGITAIIGKAFADAFPTLVAWFSRSKR